MRCVHVVCELTTNGPWAEGDKVPQFQSKRAIPSSFGLVSPFIPPPFIVFQFMDRVKRVRNGWGWWKIVEKEGRRVRWSNRYLSNPNQYCYRIVENLKIFKGEKKEIKKEETEVYNNTLH